ncbi:MAG TPA: site-specific DNA-methyltransferase, partial [Phycisphaerales bacterium]|nr:site-specific DNA-methyltransferase [Phycisphaerales bacterium]
QLDQADLDFGIYRIMNARRDEINQFLESDLLPQVREAFGEYKSSDKAEIQKELDKVVEGVKAAGMDPEQAPKVKELRARLAEEAVDVTALENEVYDHLYSFFSRYYDEGDFISLRRYKEGVYAIPYEGEEVKLHWANHDQYYIKTTEYFRDYAFKTPSGHRVHFKIAEADTEKDNIKAANGNDRRFIYRDLATENTEGTEELIIRFEYRQSENKEKQDKLNIHAAKKIIEDLNSVISVSSVANNWFSRLAAKAPTAKNPDRTILEKHLSDYTRRNTFDYFIHKDLEGFLRRELDFYIKNEVMRLDDIEEESAPRVEQYLSKIKVIRRIAHKIIDFLAQIENFQKKLWLKKKFVVETNYCVTLDRVPEELYPEIATNEAQREEWVQLFAIDKIEGDLHTPAYVEPLTVEFLKANPFLMLDTKHFSEEFKLRLIAAIENIDEQCDGLLVHSENFQALNLMLKRYQEHVKCIYIDPPYNTGKDGFAYKDRYQHSSWLAMLGDRYELAKELMPSDGIVFTSIDDGEHHRLIALEQSIFGVENFVSNIIWQKKYSPANDAKWLSDNHDFLTCFAKSKDAWRPTLLPRTKEQNARYINPDNDPRGPWKPSDASVKTYSAEYDYQITTPSGRVVYPPESRCWLTSKEKIGQLIADNRLWFGERGDNVPAVKRFLSEVKSGITPLTIWTYKEVGHNQEGAKELKSMLGGLFASPKVVRLMKRVVHIGTSPDSWILDYFAGSGTTAHAVINLNREDGGKRKYILVEMGDHFDAVLKPRIKKVVYSKDWKNGKPVSREGLSHMFKYIRLESYEDALANIELQRTEDQQRVLFPDQETSVISVSSVANQKSFRESYMLKYMLDVESRGSQTLLNIENFDDPWNYKLLVGAGSVGETKPVNVDLVETFNWLLGLKVKHIDRISGFQVVEGENPKGEKVLVIWRKIRDIATENTESTEMDNRRKSSVSSVISVVREKANLDLEAFFRKQQYNTLDSEFDVIYVNGDNNLMNVPLDPDKEGVEPRYKVRLIEEEFKQLMFDVAGV